MATKFCKSHITALKKVEHRLRMHQKMSGIPLVLGIKNESIITKASFLIADAIELLDTVDSTKQFKK